MAKVICVDALVYLGGNEMPERNEASVSFDVETVSARPFVPSLSDAFENQAVTWRTATATLNGWYDDTDFTVIDDAIAGTKQELLVYPTRSDTTAYWQAQVIISSLEHTINSEDYSELNVEAVVDGKPTFVHP